MHPPTPHDAKSSLPEERTVHATARTVARTLVLALLWLALGNAVLACLLPRDAGNHTRWLIAAKWRLLDGLREPRETLILGDSSGAQGVMPRVLDARLGGRSVNLCTVADLLTLDDAWMLDRYVAAHGPPRRVVLVHVYDAWPREPKLLPFLDLPVGPRFWRRARPPLTFTWRADVAYAWSHYAPLVSRHRSARNFLLGRPTDSRPLVRVLDDAGFTWTFDGDPGEVARDRDLHERLLSRTFGGLSEANRQGLERVAALAAEHGFDVYLAPAPIDRELGRSRPFRRSYWITRRHLETLAARHERLHLVLDDPPQFPPDVLQNVDHLTVTGARRYSELLAAAIVAIEGEAAPTR